MEVRAENEINLGDYLYYLSAQIQSVTNIILFGNKFSLNSWKEAFSKLNIKVHYSGLSQGFNTGLHLVNNHRNLVTDLEGEVLTDIQGVLWRIGGFLKSQWQYSHYLELLQGLDDIVTIINPITGVMNCSSRIRMLSLFSRARLPVVEYAYYINDRRLVDATFKMEYPIVLKVGNYEAGLMKFKINTDEQLVDFLDSMPVLTHPITIEKFIDYQHEYRSIFVGEDVYLIKRGMDRQGWKVHRSIRSEVLPVTDEILDLTLRSRDAMGLEVGAMDFVIDESSKTTILEINDSPSLDNVYLGIADNLYDRVVAIWKNYQKR